jgi:hypothetical protein
MADKSAVFMTISFNQGVLPPDDRSVLCCAGELTRKACVGLARFWRDYWRRVAGNRQKTCNTRIEPRAALEVTGAPEKPPDE